MLLHSHSGIGFSLFGLNISLYGVMITLGIIAAIFVAIWLGKKRGITSDNIFTIVLYVIPLSILGARTYFCIFSGYSFTIGEFFAIWNGGLAILGGVIGGTLGVLLYSIIHKQNFINLVDIIAPALILGQAIGRIGCFFAGCCYGEEITNTALQFFPFGLQIDGVWHWATMFWESFWCIACFVALLFIFKKFTQTGVSVCSYLILYGIGRAIIETFRGDSLFLFSSGLKVSQLLSICLIIVGVVGLVYIFFKDKKKKLNDN